MIDKGKGAIVLPTGEQEPIATVEISDLDAALLRQYKRFLQRYGLKEALYCAACWNGARADGCEAHVTDADILIRCRCCLRYNRSGTTQ